MKALVPVVSPLSCVAVSFIAQLDISGLPAVVAVPDSIVALLEAAVPTSLLLFCPPISFPVYPAAYIANPSLSLQKAWRVVVPMSGTYRPLFILALCVYIPVPERVQEIGTVILI